ncbi:hypothetical protein OCGS_1746 [Oceaniovalibus guishaninsula JLT2003]|uniref:Uncharacterized protein n=1 Tax=Oceaniovalibus guishaninsula JLT2003 TaxID=1231392 RepID=K2I5M6_9RHOB|nr:hypothetical protein [Oceaniovalibus guishaninsula]EKE44230.1 hypothetical protein OCGS_1746 [Oceaniovalibus guishaninsula JLT2003]
MFFHLTKPKQGHDRPEISLSSEPSIQPLDLGDLEKLDETAMADRDRRIDDAIKAIASARKVQGRRFDAALATRLARLTAERRKIRMVRASDKDRTEGLRHAY